MGRHQQPSRIGSLGRRTDRQHHASLNDVQRTPDDLLGMQAVTVCDVWTDVDYVHGPRHRLVELKTPWIRSHLRRTARAAIGVTPTIQVFWSSLPIEGDSTLVLRLRSRPINKFSSGNGSAAAASLALRLRIRRHGHRFLCSTMLAFVQRGGYGVSGWSRKLRGIAGCHLR